MSQSNQGLKKKKKTVEPTLKKLSLFVMGIRNKETNLWITNPHFQQSQVQAKASSSFLQPWLHQMYSIFFQIGNNVNYFPILTDSSRMI